MKNCSVKTFNLFSNFYDFFFIYKKEIIVTIGKFGTSICIFRNRKLIDYSFHKKEDDLLNAKIFQDFLRKYIEYKIYFLVDHEDSIIYHEILPVIQNLIKSSPVKSFIKSNISDNYIVAYDIIAIEKRKLETWLTIFSLLPFSNDLKKWISYCVDHGISFGGVHNLQLEGLKIFTSFFDESCKNKENSFQIFITITKAFGIFILVKNNKHIIHTKSLEYSETISQEYLQGVIENEINDCLINFKSYIADNHMEAECIFILPTELEGCFTNLKLEISRTFFIPISKLFSDFYNAKIEQGNKFSDILISKSFYLKKYYPANNNEISAIKKLTFLNKWIKRFFLIGVFIIAVQFAYGLYKLNLTTSQTNNLTRELARLLKQYNEISSDYKTDEIFNKTLDYYALNDILLSKTLGDPSKILESLTNNPYRENARINRIFWSDKTILSDVKIHDKTIIYLQFHSEDIIPSNFFKKLQDYVDNISNSLPDYSVKYKLDKQRLLRTSNISSIYVTIIISSKV
jgi:hypothetical protein